MPTDIEIIRFARVRYFNLLVDMVLMATGGELARALVVAAYWQSLAF